MVEICKEGPWAHTPLSKTKGQRDRAAAAVDWRRSGKIPGS